MHIFHGLKAFADKMGPNIMASDDRALVDFSPRSRPVVTEVDLEKNFTLVKEMVGCCMEFTFLKPEVKHEIPHLADFEAGLIFPRHPNTSWEPI